MIKQGQYTVASDVGTSKGNPYDGYCYGVLFVIINDGYTYNGKSNWMWHIFIDEDGTAVGMGVANAVTRLKDSKAKSKVIILLTDGTNNKGDISPLTAAEIAKSFGIRVYTIGVGTNGMAPYPYPVGNTVQYINMPVEIDEKTLTQIAGTTDGNYFRATSNSKLKEVYEEIDKLEKTKLNVKEYSKREEDYRWFALAAFLCVLLEVLLRNSILKKIP